MHDYGTKRELGPIRQSAVYTHGLDSAELTGDAALAALLDRYPEELIDINEYRFDERGQVTLRAGTRGDATGAELLEAVRRARIWVNLRGIEDQWLELWSRATDAFGDIAAAYPSLRAIKRSGQLIISSPGTRVPYHFDPAGVVLFHMRGIKRMFVYPSDEAHLPEVTMERVVARQTSEEVPYSLEFEADAQVFELHPGEALAWPLYAPHRVENVDGLCVSLSMEYQTWESRARTGALYTHAYMRTRGLKPPAVSAVNGPALAMKWAMSVPLRRMMVLGNRIAAIPREFVADPTASGGLRIQARD